MPPLRIPDRPGVAQILRHADGSASARTLAELAERDGADDGPQLVASLLARGVLVAPARPEKPLPGITVLREPLTARFADVLETAAASPGDEVTVVAVIGEPYRPTIRDLCERGRAHLPVVFIQDRVRIGPLTRPGESPCLDCYDAARARTDPAWPAVAVQLGAGRAPSGPPSLALLLAAVAPTLELIRRDGLGRVVTTEAEGAGSSEPVGWALTCPCHLLRP